MHVKFCLVLFSFTRDFLCILLAKFNDVMSRAGRHGGWGTGETGLIEAVDVYNGTRGIYEDLCRFREVILGMGSDSCKLR